MVDKDLPSLGPGMRSRRTDGMSTGPKPGTRDGS